MPWLPTIYQPLFWSISNNRTNNNPAFIQHTIEWDRMELSLKSNLTNKCARIIVLWIKKKNGGKTLLRILGGVCVDKWHMSRNVCDGKKSSSETEPPPCRKLVMTCVREMPWVSENRSNSDSFLAIWFLQCSIRDRVTSRTYSYISMY